MKIIFFLAFSFFLCINIFSETINAASPSHNHVQDAINSASHGDTILIPPGSATWTSQVTCSKNLIIKGSGIDVTTITMSTTIGSYTGGLIITAPGYWELTELTMVGTGTKIYMVNATVAGSEGFRVHHNKFVGYKIRFGWDYGVIDHNTFDDCGEAIDVRWPHSLDSAHAGAPPLDGKGSYSWSLPVSLGSEEAVFIEDNVFYHDEIYGHPVTAVDGGRFVFRYNTMYVSATGYSDVDAHGNYFNDRSTYSFEIYNNDLNFERPYHSYGIYLRGGRGVVFNNEMNTSGSGSLSFPICLANYRSFNDPYASYPAPDQINNVYIWNNTYNGSPVGGSVQDRGVEQDHIQLGRDYFETQLSGYTPYTYPHPLAGGSSPAPETNTEVVKPKEIQVLN